MIHLCKYIAGMWAAFCVETAVYNAKKLDSPVAELPISSTWKSSNGSARPSDWGNMSLMMRFMTSKVALFVLPPAMLIYIYLFDVWGPDHSFAAQDGIGSSFLASPLFSLAVARVLVSWVSDSILFRKNQGFPKKTYGTMAMGAMGPGHKAENGVLSIAYSWIQTYFRLVAELGYCILLAQALTLPIAEKWTLLRPRTSSSLLAHIAFALSSCIVALFTVTIAFLVHAAIEKPLLANVREPILARLNPLSRSNPSKINVSEL